MKHFYDVHDVMELLSLQKRTAHTRIKVMNDELIERGFWIERGRIPVKLFHEKYPYIPIEED